MKKKLFADLITSLLFVAAVIFAGCSNPSSSNGDTQLFSADVSKGNAIKCVYSGDNEGTRIVFDLDGTVEFYDDSGSVYARAVTRSGYEGGPCARGTYVITADNIAKITIEEVLRNWGGIPQIELEGKTLAVAFSGNDLSITIDEETLSFSYKPSSNSPLFKNGRVNATYLLKGTLTLNNGNFNIKANISFDTTEAQGKYTQFGDTIKFDDPTILGGEDATKATATISGDTLTLVIKYDEESDTDKTVFKKRGTSWEYSEEVKLFSNGDVSYYENGALCWKGTYAIINSETATVKVNNVFIKGSFGTEPGNLCIEDANENDLCLDLYYLNKEGNVTGGLAVWLLREK